MVDTSRLFEIAQRQVDNAVESSGTTVLFASPSTQPRDADTLAKPDPTPIVTEPGIVIVVTDADSEPVPGIELHRGDWKIILKASSRTPQEGEIVTVQTCRDPRLVTKSASVKGAIVDSSGAYTAVVARPGIVDD